MRILIADDSEMVRLALQELVSAWGYQVVFAKDGDEAWDILNSADPPRLALVDWIMPKMDGLTLCQKLKGSSQLPFIYVILITGKSKKEDIITGLDAGADDFLSKPPEPQELRSRLAAGVRILGYQDEIAKHNVELKKEIAERKLFEQKVRQTNKKLQESLNQLEETNQRLQEATQHKTEFLNSMNHELRTPLNGIIGFTDLLLGQFFGELNGKQLNYVNHIYNSSLHLLSLINDLLDISKIDAGKMVLDLEALDPKESIESTIDLMKPQLQKKQLTVKTFVDDSLSTFSSDKRKFQQILLNLLSNALKYTPENGTIEIKALKEGEYAKFSVSDTGVGIKKEDQEKIFEEFEQSDQIRDETLGGTGIGLALTRRLVEQHKGQINVESTLGQGSTFWFTLPLKT